MCGIVIDYLFQTQIDLSENGLFVYMVTKRYEFEYGTASNYKTMNK